MLSSEWFVHAPALTWVSCIVVTCCMWCLGPSNETVNVSYQEESWFVLLHKFDKISALDKTYFCMTEFYNRSCRLAIVEKVFRLMMILRNTLRRRWYGNGLGWLATNILAGGVLRSCSHCFVRWCPPNLSACLHWTLLQFVWSGSRRRQVL